MKSRETGKLIDHVNKQYGPRGISFGGTNRNKCSSIIYPEERNPSPEADKKEAKKKKWIHSQKFRKKQ